mmetsp:Transcript_58048/g.109375  ORF Transcript_58048/g.109375 Transcript_58048/m.109375 type:complete len:199 (+) Transcript_58048:1528-2124(+)
MLGRPAEQETYSTWQPAEQETYSTQHSAEQEICLTLQLVQEKPPAPPAHLVVQAPALVGPEAAAEQHLVAASEPPEPAPGRKVLLPASQGRKQLPANRRLLLQVPAPVRSEKAMPGEAPGRRQVPPAGREEQPTLPRSEQPLLEAPGRKELPLAIQGLVVVLLPAEPHSPMQGQITVEPVAAKSNRGQAALTLCVVVT